MARKSKKEVKSAWGLLIGVCLGGFIVGWFSSNIIYSLFDSSSEKDNVENVKINYDVKEEVENLTDIENFLVYSSVRDKNILTDAYTRLRYVTYLVENVDGICNWTTTDEETPYVSYETYAKRYYSVYGNLYSFEDDLNDENATFVANNECSIVNSQLNNDNNYICWVSSSIPNRKVDLILDDRKQAGNKYILTGTYNIHVNSQLSEEGTFEIQYLVETTDAYLESIVLYKTKDYSK